MGAGSILLISANRETCPVPAYPLAIARLAGALAQTGRRVRQFDVLVEGENALPQVLAESRPDLVGISLRNVDNADSTVRESCLDGHRRIVRTVRAQTRAPIVLGGSGFSIFPKPLLQLLEADFGVAGPGETALCALADALQNGADPSAIPGVITRDGEAAPVSSREEVFTRPLHVREIISYYWERAGMIGLQTKRGCPRNCSYCCYPCIDGRQVVWADPVELADEVERMLKDFGITYFFAADSVFNLEPAKEAAFAEELRRRALPVQWGAFFSPAGMDREYLTLLKQSGLKHCEFGADSLSDAMLNSYQKGFTVQDVLGVSALARELRLLCAHYLILGGPGETADTLRETMRNAGQIRDSVFFPFAGVRVYPNTPLHARAVADGVVDPSCDCLDPVFFCAPGLTVEAIWSIVGKGTGVGNGWVMPWQFSALNATIRQLRRRGHRGPLWELARYAGTGLIPEIMKSSA